jgi:hypothetical protein
MAGPKARNCRDGSIPKENEHNYPKPNVVLKSDCQFAVRVAAQLQLI